MSLLCYLLFLFYKLPETCWATCKREIKDNTKVTSIWFLIHTELRCTVNDTSDLTLQILLNKDLEASAS